MLSILVLHGPNLNLLGTREPEIYGYQTLADIDQKLNQVAAELNCSLSTFQSNHEGELVDRIQQAMKQSIDAIVINPAAFTHTSVAIRDAVLATGLPIFEVHLSNPHSREPFRHHSYFTDIAKGVVMGFGAKGYEYALLGAIEHLSN